MKTPEDEAFDDLAKRQGAWGGGFEAKRKAAMDKINADFDEEYIKYRTAFPKRESALDKILQEQLRLGVYGSIPQPAQEPHEYDWSMLEAAKESLREHMARIKELEAALKQALEALETSTDWNVSATGRQLKSMQAITALRTRLAQPPLPVQPQREWVGLTDEEIAQGNKESWVTKQAWESAVWWASEKLKEKNNGT